MSQAITFFSALHVSVNDHKNAVSVECGVTDTCHQAGEFANGIVRTGCTCGHKHTHTHTHTRACLAK